MEFSTLKTCYGSSYLSWITALLASRARAKSAIVAAAVVTMLIENGYRQAAHDKNNMTRSGSWLVERYRQAEAGGPLGQYDGSAPDSHVRGSHMWIVFMC